MNQVITQSQKRPLITIPDSAMQQLWTCRKPIYDGAWNIIGYEFDAPEALESAHPELFAPVGIDVAKGMLYRLARHKRIDGGEDRINFVLNDIAKEIQDIELFAVIVAMRDIKLDKSPFMPNIGEIVDQCQRARRRRGKPKEAPKPPNFVQDAPRIRRRTCTWLKIKMTPEGCRTSWQRKFIAAYQPGKG